MDYPAIPKALVLKELFTHLNILYNVPYSPIQLKAIKLHFRKLQI